MADIKSLLDERFGNNKVNTEPFSVLRVQMNELFSDMIDWLVQNGIDRRLITPASPIGQLFNVMTSLYQMYMYYLEDSVSESNIFTATRPSSIFSLARLNGYNIDRSVSAKGKIRIIGKQDINKLPSSVLVLRPYTKLVCVNNGLNYFINSDSDIYIRSGDIIELEIIQGTIRSVTFTGKGQVMESHLVLHNPFQQIENDFIKVYVNGERYQKVDSLLDALPGQKAFMVETSPLAQGVAILFGDGNNFGTKIPLGSVIEVYYVISNGYGGNVFDQDIKMRATDFVYDIYGNELNIDQYLSIQVIGPISGGINPPDVNLVRVLATNPSKHNILVTENNVKFWFERFGLFKVKVIDTDTENSVINVLLYYDIKRLNKDYFKINPQTDIILDSNMKNTIVNLLERDGKIPLGYTIKIHDPQIVKCAVNIYVKTKNRSMTTSQMRQVIMEIVADNFINMYDGIVSKSEIIKMIENNIDGVVSVMISFASENPDIITNSGDIDPRLIGDDIIPFVSGGFEYKGVYYGSWQDKIKPVNIIIEQI